MRIIKIYKNFYLIRWYQRIFESKIPRKLLSLRNLRYPAGLIGIKTAFVKKGSRENRTVHLKISLTDMQEGYCTASETRTGRW